MSMVFQSFALMPQRTVLSNAAFGLEVAGVGRKERDKRAMSVLEQVGLASFALKLPAQLSGGMQQRVGLARALAVNPSLMIMDEAFSALDPLKRKEMQNVLLDLQREQQRTIMFVSHDLEEAMRIGTRIAIMEGGRVVQIGTPQEIIANPADDYVRAFFEGIDTSRYLTAGDLMQADAVPLMSHGARMDASSVAQTAQRQRRLRVRHGTTNEGFAASCVAMQSARRSPELNLIECIQRTTPLDDVVTRVVNSRAPLPVVEGGRLVLWFDQQDERTEGPHPGIEVPMSEMIPLGTWSTTASSTCLITTQARSTTSARSSSISPNWSSMACKPFRCG